MNAILRLSSVPTNRALNSLFINAQLIVQDETDGFFGKFGVEGFTVTKIKVLQADENPTDIPEGLPEVDLSYHAYAPATRWSADCTGRIVVVPLKIRVDTARSLVGVQTNSDSELAVMVRPLFVIKRHNMSDYQQVGEPTYHHLDHAYKSYSSKDDYPDISLDISLVQLEVFVKKTDTGMLGDDIFPAQTNLNQNGITDAPASSATQPVELQRTKE